MSDHLVSHTTFVWLLSLATGLFAGTWFVYDGLKIWWLRRADAGDPVVHDQRFGYAVGMIVGAIGVIGVLKYHL